MRGDATLAMKNAIGNARIASVIVTSAAISDRAQDDRPVDRLSISSWKFWKP